MPHPITRIPGCGARPARAPTGNRRPGRARLLGLLLCPGTLAACASSEPDFVGEIAVLEADHMLVVERRDGTVSASDLETGKKLWTVRPQPEIAPGFVTVPTRRLVCPIERTLAGTLLLRFHTRLVAIDGRNGERLWERKVIGWATHERRCPRAAADSGVLTLRADGLLLQKLNTNGEDDWLFSLEPFGPALAPVSVAMPSGDALVRTKSFFVSVSPNGELGWVEPR